MSWLTCFFITAHYCMYGIVASWACYYTRNQGCGSGPFSVEAQARKFYRFCVRIGYLTWRVIWRNIFVCFLMWFKQWSCTISLNVRAIPVAQENEKKHRGKLAPTSHFFMISSVATTRCNIYCSNFSSKCLRVVACFVGIYGAKYLQP